MTPKSLNDYLLKTGLTYQQFAKILGVTPGAVAHWLNGKRKIPEMVVKIIDYFEDNIKEFA